MQQKILLVYTGGTIGMVKDSATGALKAFDFDHLLVQIPQLKSVQAQIDTVSVPEPKDSADMNPSDWQFLGNLIYSKFMQYDGFVVLHGTDTMSYTASALSFMFSNLRKPIIFTGSQLPVGDIRTDALENVLTAIQIALLQENGVPSVSEVGVYFDSQLFRGNRSTKVSSDRFKAFMSPNFPALVTSGVSLKINEPMLLKPNLNRVTKFSEALNDKVLLVKIHPGITTKMFEQLCASVDFEVLIMETYGSGTIFNANWLALLLKELQKKGKNIINCSQCVSGVVKQGIYQGSEQLKSLGIISAKDMTTEAAITKAMYLLGQNKQRNDFKIEFEANLRGEMH
ncbi:asparaginase [Aquimarina agarilytica]|uniref:asparaginase n=1 Tax=Aquimarina agarilytica TaxID=1087449 RepID=UPI0002898D15|nr:asparaginase [Aquimarina agarilytica]